MIDLFICPITAPRGSAELFVSSPRVGRIV